MPGSVFISYRRTGSAKDARAIFERLRRELAGHDVFIDLEGIEPGEDFVESLERQLDGCEALVVLIGPDWSDVTNEHGLRRLDDENDFVRIEIAAALRRGVKVFPVLIDGARPPLASELPDVLRPIVRRQAVALDYTKFDTDVIRLARAIAKALEPRSPARPSAGLDMAATVSEPPTAPAPQPSAAVDLIGAVATVSMPDAPPLSVAITANPAPVDQAPPAAPELPTLAPAPLPGPDVAVSQPRQASDADNRAGDVPEAAQPVAAAEPVPLERPQTAVPDDLPGRALAKRRVALRWRLMLLLVAASAVVWGAITLSARQDRAKAITAGAAVYKSANCIACHGENGAKSIDPSYPQLSSSKLVSGPKADLVRYFANLGTEKEQPIMLGIVKPMPDDAVAFVATYIRSVVQPPTGDLVTAEEVHAARKHRPPDFVRPVPHSFLEPLSKDTLMADGAKVYAANCAACHRPDGRGAGPIKPLDQSALVTGPADRLIDVILHGAANRAMPAWRDVRTEAELASVATYIRNSWHNETGDVVQPRDVAAVAQRTPKR